MWHVSKTFADNKNQCMEISLAACICVSILDLTSEEVILQWTSNKVLSNVYSLLIKVLHYFQKVRAWVILILILVECGMENVVFCILFHSCHWNVECGSLRHHLNQLKSKTCGILLLKVDFVNFFLPHEGSIHLLSYFYLFSSMHWPCWSLSFSEGLHKILW